MTKNFDRLVQKIMYETDGGVSTTYENQNKWYDAMFLNEGLIRSHGPEGLIRNLKKKKYYLGDSSPKIDPITKTFIIKVFLNPDYDDLSLNSLLDAYGYFVSRSQIYKNGTELVLEPKFPIKIEIEDLPEYFYHVTPKIYIDKIKKIGLVPKKSSRIEFKSPQNRTYLISVSSANIKGVLTTLAKELQFDHEENSENIESIKKYRSNSYEDYIFLRIKSENLVSHSLYYDPQFSSANGIFSIFTLRNIHPDSIEILK